MDKMKIYLDTNILIPNLKKVLEKKDPTEGEIIKFLNNHKEKITSFISVITESEIIKVFMTDDKFKRYHINDKDSALSLLSIIQDTMKFESIEMIDIGKDEDFLDYVSTHPHIVDCIHLSIARNNKLTFVTSEKSMGELKKVYGNIMTFNKLMKQF